MGLFATIKSWLGLSKPKEVGGFSVYQRDLAARKERMAALSTGFTGGMAGQRQKALLKILMEQLQDLLLRTEAFQKSFFKSRSQYTHELWKSRFRKEILDRYITLLKLISKNRFFHLVKATEKEIQAEAVRFERLRERIPLFEYEPFGNGMKNWNGLIVSKLKSYQKALYEETSRQLREERLQRAA